MPKYTSAQKKEALVVCSTTSTTLLETNTATVSTGIRFTTLPDATPPSFQVPVAAPNASSSTPRAPPSQPPTTITALFNPMLGHMSGAYTARVSRDLALSSRFDFNVYSFESEWAMGVEWWLRRPPTSPSDQDGPDTSSYQEPPSIHSADVHGVVKARASTNNVRCIWTIILIVSNFYCKFLRTYLSCGKAD